MVRYISLLLFIGLAFWSCGEQEPEQNDTQEEGPISIELPDCPPLENINEENLCTADDGTDGVKILGECYSIENPTFTRAAWRYTSFSTAFLKKIC